MAWPDFSDIQTRVRDLLNESTAGMFTDAAIKRWINDGERDIAIKALCLESIYSKTTTASTRTVATPYNKVMHVEYVPGSGNPVGLVKITPLHVGNVPVDGSTPQYWFPWGKTIGIEPLSASTYTLNVYASILPTIEMSDNTDEPQIPKAFHEDIVTYAVYRGLIRKWMFRASAGEYVKYISSIQAKRDLIIERYKTYHLETRMPDRVQAA